MPNTKLKKHKHANKTVRTKRAIIQDEEGWAHVVGGRTIKPDASKTKITKKGGFDIVTYTLKEITVKYESLREKWEGSDACRELIALLEPYKEKNQIKNVVVMGLGSFQMEMGDVARSSLTQLAALTTIITTLRASFMPVLRKAILTKYIEISNIPVVAQDPAFSPLDKEFLQTHGIEVVQSPDGFDLIDANTLVYAIHCYPIVYNEVGKKGAPAVLVGNDLNRLTDGPM